MAMVDGCPIEGLQALVEGNMLPCWEQLTAEQRLEVERAIGVYHTVRLAPSPVYNIPHIIA
jgi:hypothetical protein